MVAIIFAMGNKVQDSDSIFIPYAKDDIDNAIITTYFTAFGEIETYGKNVSKNLLLDADADSLNMDRFSKLSVSLFVSIQSDVMGMIIRYDNRSTINAYVNPENFEVTNAKNELRKVNTYRIIALPEHRSRKLDDDCEDHLLYAVELIRPGKWEYYYLFYQRPLASSLIVTYKGIPFMFGEKSDSEVAEEAELEDMQKQLRKAQDKLRNKKYRIERFGKDDTEGVAGDGRNTKDNSAEEAPPKPAFDSNRKFFTF